MLKALIKKQLLELCSAYFMNRKTGKMRSKAGIAGYIALFGFVFLSVGFMFFGMFGPLAASLSEKGLDWLYFSLTGLMSIVLGVFGSVFNTHASLYRAKDNEMLLSMPIQPMTILIVRMSGVFITGLLYESLVFVPAIICYLSNCAFSAGALIFQILLLIVIALFVMSLSCVFGWVVAAISSHLKNKSYATVIASLIFIAGYYFIYFRINKYLQAVIENAEEISKTVKTVLFPLYHFGLSATGKPLSFAAVFLTVAALAALTCFVLSRSYVHIVTLNRGSKKKVYREHAVKAYAAGTALLRKELKRFTSSAAYMLNCGLGIVILPVAAVYLLIRADDARVALAGIAETAPFILNVLPSIAVAIVCFVLSMNSITSPSISLEGSNLWLLQSLPVKAYEVLRAKVRLHVLLNFLPGVICTVALGYVLGADILTVLLMVAWVLLFIWVSALFGLMLNLRHPNLTWTNEAVPIKQSFSSLISIFADWALAGAFIGGAFLFSFAPKWVFPLAASAVTAGLSLLLNKWMKTKGAARFERL